MPKRKNNPNDISDLEKPEKNIKLIDISDDEDKTIVKIAKSPKQSDHPLKFSFTKLANNLKLPANLIDFSNQAQQFVDNNDFNGLKNHFKKNAITRTAYFKFIESTGENFLMPTTFENCSKTHDLALEYIPINKPSVKGICAIKYCNNSTIRKKFIDHTGINLDAMPNGDIPMHFLIQNHNLIAFKQISKSALLKTTHHGETALDIAIQSKFNWVVKELIAHNVTQFNPYLLFDLVKQGNTEIVEILLTLKPEINIQDERLETLLHHATRQGVLGLISTLLAAGANPDILNSNGFTARKLINSYGDKKLKDEVAKCPETDPKKHVPVISEATRKIIIKIKANLQPSNQILLRNILSNEIANNKDIIQLQIILQNIPSQIFAYLAVRDNHTYSPQELIGLPYVINNPITAYSEEPTILHLKAKNNDVEGVKQLLTVPGCNPNSMDKLASTPLLTALDSGALPVVKVLIKNPDVNIDASDDKNRFPLIQAFLNNHHELFKMMLERKSKAVNIKLPNGEYLIHTYVKMGNLAIVKKIIACGININVTNDSEQTALHLACSDGNEMMVKLLLENNADPKITYKGKTAIDMVKALGQDGAEILPLFESIVTKNPAITTAYTQGNKAKATDKHKSQSTVFTFEK